MAASSSSATPQLKNFDVFLSFRGEDTRNNFTRHLYVALCRKKIETFMDDQLIRGDEISSSLLNTIKASKISVIIFSLNYASSRWCLQELEHILDCKETKQQIVIPIFHKVDPSHVRHQKESFGKGFAELQDRFKEKPEMLQRWKSALNEAAGLSGWTIDEKTSEPELIDEILGAILKRLNKLSPSDYKGLVGVKFSINKIESLLHKGSNGVSKIGIWGIGGIGKTTIARVVFNKILNEFEGSYFAENVREESEKNSSLTHLRNELLSTILDDINPNIGLTITRRRLQDKKVFIVFDDVTSVQQIENLIGNLNLLSSESQIIITTRDKQVLRNCDIDDAYIYNVHGLGEKEAHQLFNRYAFKQYSPIADYMELSKKVVAYTKCVPLALKVLGSSLFSKEKDFWESAIKKLEKSPPSDIHKVLKVSYDALDKEEKVIFLDIVCFLKVEHIDLVIEILNACDLFAKQGIQVLIDKCLMYVRCNKIIIHDLLQEMGREIARDDTCKEIRLWQHEDIFKAFKKDKEIEAVRSISLDISKISNTGLDCRVLSKMHNLKFFRVYNSQDGEDIMRRFFGLSNSQYQDDHENNLKGFQHLQSFSNDLIFFSWKGYPFKSVPNHFPSKSLVRLDMPFNKVKHWNGVQNLVNLKYVDLSFSIGMQEIPNLSRALNLQILILKHCSSLLEIIPSSIQNLNKLVVLDLSDCKRLISLPDGIQSRFINLTRCHNLKIAPKMSCKVEILFLTETAIKESPFIEHPSRLFELDLVDCSSLESLSSSICKLKFLKKLNLWGCSKLERLPDDFGDLEALQFLSTEHTIIKEVPSSILHLPNLNSLFLSRDIDEATPLNWVLNSASGSSSFEVLHFENCQISKLPDNLGQLSFLEKLYLRGNNFESIPENIKDLSNLDYLDISKCQRLRSLPELPIGVNVIARDCSSLESISDPSFLLLPYWTSRTVDFADCLKLDLLKVLHKESCREFCAGIRFPGNEIPKWFSFQSTGSYIALDESLDWHNKNFLGFLTSAVVCREEESEIQYHVTCYCSVKSKDGKEQVYEDYIESWNYDDKLSGYNWNRFSGDILSDHVYLGFHSVTGRALRESEEFEELNCKVLIQFHSPNVKKCGIHFLYVEDYGEPLKTSRRIVDYAKMKGKEIVDEPQSIELQILNSFDDECSYRRSSEPQSIELHISNQFDGECSLRPRFMSKIQYNLRCLEAHYWKLKRNALREIVKNALLFVQQNTTVCSEVEEMTCENPKGCMCFPGSEIAEWFSFQNNGDYVELPAFSFSANLCSLAFCTIVEFQDLVHSDQTFFVRCECHIGEDGSLGIIAIGSIKGWFECDKSCYIQSNLVFLGYDCVMYTSEASEFPSGRTIINFSVTTHDGVPIEGCKVKKCGVRLLCPQDFENKWKNSIDLSSLNRRLKLNANAHGNDESQSYGLCTSRDWQSRSSVTWATSLDLNEIVGSTVIGTTKSHSKRLKRYNYKNTYEDEKEVEELNPSTSQPIGDDEDEQKPKRLKEFNLFGRMNVVTAKRSHDSHDDEEPLHESFKKLRLS